MLPDQVPAQHFSDVDVSSLSVSICFYILYSSQDDFYYLQIQMSLSESVVN